MQFLLVPLCIAAAHFQTATNVAPTDENKYLVEVQIRKGAELVACPKFLCEEGHPSQLTSESEDRGDLLSIDLLVEDKTIRTSVLMKENNEVVLDHESVMRLKDL